MGDESSPYAAMLAAQDVAVPARSSAFRLSTLRFVAPEDSVPRLPALVAKPLSAPSPVLASRLAALKTTRQSLPTALFARVAVVVVVSKRFHSFGVLSTPCLVPYLSWMGSMAK